MSDLVKVAVTGIIAAVCAVVLRKQVPELAMLLSICAGAMILLYCSGAISSVRTFMDELATAGGLTSAVVEPVVKVTGIAVITRLAADFCKDAKESGIASAVEMAGSALALLTTIPLMSAVLELLGTLL